MIHAMHGNDDINACVASNIFQSQKTLALLAAWRKSSKFVWAQKTGFYIVQCVLD